jgi:CelD/BcsL family acetyltransferase involved in cellulose biosynthesis
MSERRRSHRHSSEDRRERSEHRRSRRHAHTTAPLLLHWQRLPAKRLFDTAALSEAWDRLNAARGALPFLDTDVLQLAFAAFRPKGVELLVGDVAGQTQCMLLVQRVGFGRWQLYQPSQIPLGPLVAASNLPLDDIARSALKALPFTTLVLSFTQLDPRHWPPPAEPACVVKRYISTGWIDCAQPFDSYWAARSANLRASVGKAQRRLEAEGRTLRLRVLTEPADMAAAVERYGLLEASGWKGRKGTAVAAGTPQGNFYRDWLQEAAAHGEARVYELLLSEPGTAATERTIAADLCVVRGDALILLKIAYDEAFEHYSPSTLLRREFMQDLLGSGRVRRVEFFGRLMDWHRRWTGEQRSLYHLTTFRWRWLAKLRAPSSDRL